MIKGKLAEKNYKPRFSGHETFPFRYLWISKLLLSIKDHGHEKLNKMSLSPNRSNMRKHVLKILSSITIAY